MLDLLFWIFTRSKKFMGIAQRKAFKPRGGLAARNGERSNYQRTSQRLSGSTRDSMAMLKPIVFQNANFTCRRCSKSKSDFPDLILTCDHIIPLAQGGRTNLANLMCLCIDCHINKLGKVNRRGAKLLAGTKRRLQGS